MAMDKGRKGLALAIISKMPKPGADKGDDEGSDYGKDEEKGDEDSQMGMESAARAVRKAIEGKDDEALASALKDFLDIC